MRLHTGGSLRRWIGARFGGGEELGDRVWRRALHLVGGLVLLYYLLPPGFFLVLSVEEVLLLGLAAVLLLEAARHLAGVELPTIRPYERRRVASYAFYAVALTVVVIVFPRPVAWAAVLGVAIVDPLLGELRPRSRSAWTLVVLPVAVYAALAGSALSIVGGYAPLAAGLGGGLMALVGVAVERPKLRVVDDDLAMTLAPAVALELLLLALPQFPGLVG